MASFCTDFIRTFVEIFMMPRQRNSMVSEPMARFDTRLSLQQKNLLERAAAIQGYKSLSEFVIRVTHEKAQEIVDRHESILASESDREVFFQTLTDPPAPYDALKKAAKAFMEEREAK